MKQFIKFAAAAAVLALSTSASADVMKIDFKASNAAIPENGEASYTFDFFTDYDYAAGKDTIDWAKLSLRLKDFGGSNHGSETFSFLLGANGSVNIGGGKDIDNGVTPPYNFDILGTSLADLSRNGTLKLTIKAKTGTFQWEDASLQANRIVYKEEVVGQPGSVPEPLSVALMGLGLAGIAAVRRKA